MANAPTIYDGNLDHLFFDNEGLLPSDGDDRSSSLFLFVLYLYFYFVRSQ